MKIAVLGAGGVGGYFGGMLAHAGHQVHFIARGQHLDAIRAHGLVIENPQGDRLSVQVAASDSSESAKGADLVIVAVKGWQLESSLPLIAELCGPDTVVLPLLNGIEAPEILAGGLPSVTVLGGLCGIIAYIGEPGMIKHAAIDPFIIFGALENVTTFDAAVDKDAKLNEIEKTLGAADFRATLVDDVRLAMWRKYLFICPLSAVTSVARSTIGAVRDTPETLDLLDTLIDETIAVGQSEGVELTKEHRDSVKEQILNGPAEGTTSMQRDIQSGRPSELQTQLGCLVRLAEANKVAAPLATTLYKLLKPQENSARAV